MVKVLHAASECFGLAKTGGLADVVAALPAALQSLGAETRICLPAYRGVRERLADVKLLGRLSILEQEFEVLEGRLPDKDLSFWLLAHPALYERAGDPYHDASGAPFEDNFWRFGVFGAAVAQLARGVNGWRPDVVHLHDWQAGLAAPWLATRPARPRIVFTIHNLAYQGDFRRAHFDALRLPAAWWSIAGLEFHGGFSFMKAGLVHSDAITTVSPSYAREIRTPAFGYGLDGVLNARAPVLHGIVNGIDQDLWNPSDDRHLHRRYATRDAASGKRANKAVLQAELGLARSQNALLVFIGRFAHQKGADLILAARAALEALPIQIAILGAGDHELESRFLSWSLDEPGRVALRVGYDEPLAHRLTASADLQLMPSRFEPCGLNQMYAQRYGSLPVVRRTGGLADTVVDASPEALRDGSATGVHFENADAGGIAWGVGRALELLADAGRRDRLRRTGMTRDFSWSGSARRYLQLYQDLLGP